MSAVAVPPAGLARRAAPPLGSLLVVRLGTFAALALFAALHWAALEAPAARGRLALCAAVALAAAVATHFIGRLPRIGRAPALAALALVSLALVLVAAGVPSRLLAPAHWGDLAGSLGQGIESLPGIGVPYRGVDPWVRVVLIAGGGLLLVLGGVLAVRALRRDRRPLGAAVVLATAYVIPIVEHAPSHQYLWGAVFTLLVGALLWADRIERTYAAPAAVFVAVAIAGGAIAAPRLDSGKPWIDYQGLIESLGTSPGIKFDWNHGYGPLDWPRDNREMLRIAAKTPVYWKAVDLDGFDGVGWKAERIAPPGGATEEAPNHRDWHVKLRVTVRDLRTSAYVTAGTALRIDDSPRYAIPSSPGTFATGRDALRRGDSYTAEVYTPHPSLRELGSAGTDYPPFVDPYLTMELPASVGGPATNQLGAPSTLGPVRLLFAQFGLLSLRQPPTAFDPRRNVYFDGAALLRNSQYAQMYALVQRLRESAHTPYQFVRAVQARLATGYAYTETPPSPRAGRPPLVSFLFDTRAGYCQQFSGAMALMLRMGGVPTRVGSGFTSGTYDKARGEWVVRDVDAHSWVEAYFPKLGWVPFDPTPGVAPPHGQLANGPLARDPRVPALRPDSRRADVPGGGEAGSPASAQDSSVSIWLLIAGALTIGFGAAGAAFAVRARRRDDELPAELAELGRALRRTGRPIGSRMTLQSLEQRYAKHAPEAAAYVAAVRLARFGGRPEGPTAQQRAALRAELASGLGAAGRLRAWWALPPAWPSPR